MFCVSITDHPAASSSLCDIQHPFETSLVKAYLEEPVSVLGCSSDVLTSSGAEVHVILYRSKKKKQTVELILQNEENTGENVLLCEVPLLFPT